MSVRNLRKEKNISNKVLLELKIKVNNSWLNNFDSLIVKLCNLSSIDFCENSIDRSYSFIVKNNEFFVPFTDTIDAELEIKNIKSELSKKHGFLKSVLGKLNNSRFVDNAPKKVVELEKKKKDNAEKQIKILEERLNNLSS